MHKLGCIRGGDTFFNYEDEDGNPRSRCDQCSCPIPEVIQTDPTTGLKSKVCQLTETQYIEKFPYPLQLNTEKYCYETTLNGQPQCLKCLQDPGCDHSDPYIKNLAYNVLGPKKMYIFSDKCIKESECTGPEVIVKQTTEGKSCIPKPVCPNGELGQLLGVESAAQNLVKVQEL